MFTPMYQNRNGHVADSPGNPASCDGSNDDTVMAVPVDKLRKMGCLMFVPSINHVTWEEFNTLPK